MACFSVSLLLFLGARALASWAIIDYPTTSAPVNVDFGDRVEIGVRWDVTDHPDYNPDRGVTVAVTLQRAGADDVDFELASGSNDTRFILNADSSVPGSYDVTVSVYDRPDDCTSVTFPPSACAG